MEWTEEYVFGHPLFDRFHALISACHARKGREEIARLYDFLYELCTIIVPRKRD